MFRRNEDEIDVDEITACLNKTFCDIEEEIKCVASTVLCCSVMIMIYYKLIDEPSVL